MPPDANVFHVTLDDIRHVLDRRRPRRVEVTADLHEAAVAVVLVPDPQGGLRALFIKRAEYPDDPWSGQMALPGGRRDPGDQDLLATVTRETREETGIGLPPAALLGGLDDLSPVTAHLPRIVVRPFVFGFGTAPDLHHSPEVALHVWVPLAELSAARVTEAVHVRGQTLVMPGYRVGPHFIWGMTERIITAFLDLIRA